MRKPIGKKPTVLVVGADPWYAVWLGKWFEDFYDVIVATSYGMAEKELSQIGVEVDMIIVEGFGKEMAMAFQHRFKDALVCLLTMDPYITCNDKRVHCIQRPKNKKVALVSISNLWLLHRRTDERMRLMGKEKDLVEVYRRDPQKDLEALYFHLAEDPNVKCEGVVLRHSDHLDQVNFCLPLQRGCAGGCRMCATAKLKKFTRKFKASEIAAMWGHLLTSYKSFGCKQGKISTAFHGGGDPRFCVDELCGSIEMIENRYGLNSRYIVTSVGSEKVFKQLFERLNEYDMSFELSAHSTDKGKRDWLMPVTKQDSLSRLVEMLADDSVRNNRKNKYRHLLIKGFNDSREEAKGIAKLVAETPLRVILMKIEPGCLPEYPDKMTDQDVENFQRMLADEGVKNFCHNKNIGKGMVKCGMHIDINDRADIKNELGKTRD